MAYRSAETYTDTDGDYLMVVTFDDGKVTVTAVSTAHTEVVTVILTQDQVQHLIAQLHNAY